MSEEDEIFRKTVSAFLKLGYGVEDIAHQTGYAVQIIRSEIKAMREDGAIVEIYGVPV